MIFMMEKSFIDGNYCKEPKQLDVMSHAIACAIHVLLAAKMVRMSYPWTVYRRQFV